MGGFQPQVCAETTGGQCVLAHALGLAAAPTKHTRYPLGLENLRASAFAAFSGLTESRAGLPQSPLLLLPAIFFLADCALGLRPRPQTPEAHQVHWQEPPALLPLLEAGLLPRDKAVWQTFGLLPDCDVAAGFVRTQIFIRLCG